MNRENEVSLRIAHHLRQAANMLGAIGTPPKKFGFNREPNLARALGGMLNQRLDGFEREVAEENAYQAGEAFDPQRILIRFDQLATRDLTKGTASAGGYLAGGETQEAIDILRPWSVTNRAGILVETGLRGDQLLPKTTAKATPAWLSSEASTVSGSTPTLAQIAMTPKTAAAQVQFSRQFALQANADAFVRRELLRTVGTAVDQAVLNGSGAAGQPTGLLNTPGIGTESGTSLAQPGVSDMKYQVANANAPDDAISFIGTPAVRKLLEGRPTIPSGFIPMWADGRLASRPASVTTDLPAGTLICGAWPAIYLGIWGEAFVLEVNPYDPTAFKVGSIQARILLSCDVAVLQAAAFCAATSIT